MLDHLDFSVERLTATRFGDQEFYVTLRRIPRGADRVEASAQARAALATLRDALPEESPAVRSGDDATVPAHVVADLERRLAETRARLVKVRASRDRLRRQRDGAAEPAGGRSALSALLRRRRRPEA